MKRRIIIQIGSIIFTLFIIGAIFGCSVISPIVGKWQETDSRDTIEFTSGGDVILKTGSNVMTGKYELVGSDVVKIKLEGFSGAWMSLFGGDTWQSVLLRDGARARHHLGCHLFNMGNINLLSLVVYTDGG